MLQLVKIQTSDVCFVHLHLKGSLMSDPNPEKLQKHKESQQLALMSSSKTGRPRIHHYDPQSKTANTIRRGGKYALRHLYQHLLLNPSQAKPAIKVAAIVRAKLEENDAVPSSHD